MIIQEILKQLILEKGVNVSDVVRETGLSPTPIYAILNGKAKRPLSSTINKLANYFGVSPKYLLTGESGAETDNSELNKKIGEAVKREFQKRLDDAGPSLNKVRLHDGQRQKLYDTYVARGIFTIVENFDDLSPADQEVAYRLMYLWDEIIRKGKTNGEPKP